MMPFAIAVSPSSHCELTLDYSIGCFKKPPRALRAQPESWYDLFILMLARIAMGTAVKKTISLPADLARDTEALARAEGKTLSAVIQDALREARIARRLHEFRGIQGYWSRQAREKGILTEEDLEHYLGE
jgi:predicted transcriptional regulator